jgi:hypothetical protein
LDAFGLNARSGSRIYRAARIGTGETRISRKFEKTPCQIPYHREFRFGPPDGIGMLQTPCYRPSAALTSFTPSSLAHSAGPDSEAISHPFGSISSVVGMPIALPTALRSWKTLALASE